MLVHDTTHRSGNNITRTNNGCSIAMIHEDDILELARIHLKDPMHSGCRDALLRPIITNPPQFYYNGVHQRLTPQFEQVVQQYWSHQFCADFLTTLWILGVVPVTLLELSDGTKVPHVLKLGTYKLGVYHSPESEAQCYVVYRTALAGTSFLRSNNGNRLADNLNSHMPSSVGGSLPSVPNQRLRRLMHGPNYLDDRQSMTRRLDMGELFPELGQPDPCCVVLSGFGYDPLLTGELTSVVSRTYPAYARWRLMNELYLVQEQRLAVEQPFVETERPSESFITNMTVASVPPRGFNDIGADDGTVHHVQRSQAEINLQVAMMQQQRERTDELLAASHIPSAVLGNGMGPAAAAEGLQSFSRFAENTRAHRSNSSNYSLVQPGGKVANFHAQLGGRNLETINREYTERVAAAYGVPMEQFHNKATSRTDTSTQQASKHETLHFLLKHMSLVLTRFYDVIYGEQLLQSEMDFLCQRFLSEEAIGRLVEHVDEVERSERMQLIGAVQQRDMEDGVSSRVAVAATASRQRGDKATVATTNDSAAAAAAAGDFDKKTGQPVGPRILQRNEDGTFRKVVYDQGQTKQVSINPQDYLNGSQVSRIDRREDNELPFDVPDTVEAALDEREQMLARFALRRIFLQQLQRSPDVVRQLFMQGTPDQQNWMVTEGLRSATQRTEEHVRTHGSGRVTVTLVYSTPQSQEYIDRMLVSGAINDHEWLQDTRTRLFLPITCDDSNVSKNLPLKQWAEFLGNSELTRILKESPLGAIASAMQGAAQTDRKEKEKEAQQRQKEKEQKAASKTLGKRKRTTTTTKSSAT